MLALADHLLVLTILIGLPVRAFFSMRALRAAAPDTLVALRRRIWINAIASQWLLAALVLALTLALGRSPASLLLVPRPTAGLLGVMLGLATMVSLVVRQRGSIASDADVRARIRERLAPVVRLMPASRAEYRLFAVLACTAGLCEEFLFRGYLLWYGTQFLPVLWAGLAQAVLFGVAHFYQGRRGILLTGFAGIFLTAVTFVTGSLWAAVLIHALMDLNAGDLALRALGPEARPAESV
jgi:membrane protease YdiL (CAAX protease family)